MQRRNLLLLIFCIIVCQAAGIVGSIFTAPAIPAWYASLDKPFFNPPNWLFAPVWILLYFLMGISLYIVIEKRREIKKIGKPLAAFGIQLGLNTMWSVLFFGYQSPLYGFICIIVLWLAIVLTISEFFKISRKAAFILMPYLAWVSFAAILNYNILILNP